MPVIDSVRWAPQGDAVRIVDQRALPERLVERDLRTLDDVCDAIASLAVRGAPAIGIAAAMGLVVAMRPFAANERARLLRRIEEAAARLRATRPTAVNLPWAMDRMVACARSAAAAGGSLLELLRDEATAILDEDRAMCERIGEHGLPLVPDGARVLTHCNAGALATAGIGTALAPLYRAAAAGRRIEVFVGETRPLLQGSRLTAWELGQAGIPVTVLVDGAVASLLRSGAIDLCLVGADRIAANGDVANKVGTYGVALAAWHHDVPLYVAAPTSTIDPATPDGSGISIEQRAPDEVRAGLGRQSAPAEARIHNPAFDITPAVLVRAIITDRGIRHAPFDFAGERVSAA